MAGDNRSNSIDPDRKWVDVNDFGKTTEGNCFPTLKHHQICVFFICHPPSSSVKKLCMSAACCVSVAENMHDIQHYFKVMPKATVVY